MFLFSLMPVFRQNLIKIEKYSGSSDVPLGETVFMFNSKYKCALEYRTKVKIILMIDTSEEW